MKEDRLQAEPLLTPAEVSELFYVNAKTTTRWAKAGKLHPIRTLGGHRRYLAKEVHALLRGETWEPEGGWPENGIPAQRHPHDGDEG